MSEEDTSASGESDEDSSVRPLKDAEETSVETSERWSNLELGALSGSVTATRPQDCSEEEEDSEDNVEGHQFEVETLSHPGWCSQCDTFLVGLWHQGQKCSLCHMLTCHNCAEVAGPCLANRMRSAESREAELRRRIQELEELLASRGGTGVALRPCRGSKDTKLQQLHQRFLKEALQVPDVQVEDYLQTQPLYSSDLGITLKEVTTALLQPSFLERVIQADSGGFDITASPWGPAQQPHHRLRCLKYKVPIPSDLPSAVLSVLTLPKYGTCRALCRLNMRANEVVLTLQFVAEGLPFSDSVRLQVTDAFVPRKNGRGSTLRRWAAVFWIKELPWALRFLKTVVVSQVMDRGRRAADILVGLLMESAQL